MNKTSKVVLLTLICIILLVILVIGGLILFWHFHDSSIHNVSDHTFFPSTDEILSLSYIEEKNISKLTMLSLI